MAEQNSVCSRGSSNPVVKEAYYRPEYVDLEKQRLWPRVWQVACRLEELREVGSYVTYDVGDESVVVVRDADGGVNALHNVCRHRGRKITAGCGVARRLRCPFHGWQWALDGRNTFVSTREDWDGELDGENLDLPKVRCETWGGWVFINFDMDAEPLASWLGEAGEILAPFELEKMRYRWRKWLVMPCNWKIGLEAFNEGYHVKVTHSQLTKYGLPTRYYSASHGPHSMFDIVATSDFVNGYDRDADPRESVAGFLNYMKGALDASLTDSIIDAANSLVDDLPAGATRDEALGQVMVKAMELDRQRGAEWPAITPEQYQRAGTDWHIFPNMILLQMANNCLCYRVRPNGDDPNSCIFEVYQIERYPEGEEPEVENLRNDDIYDEAFWGEFLLQDFQQMEGTHKGQKSSSFPGPRLNPAEEQAIVNFHRVYNEYLQRE